MPEIDYEKLLAAGFAPDEIEANLKLMAQHRRFNRMDFFEPYPKQREFFAMGKVKKQRLLMAGNRMGKSMAGAYEMACHLTGLYPKDWEGYKFTHAINTWACGETAEIVRNVQQKALCGEPGITADFGTGFIPKHCFVAKPKAAMGIPDGYDTVAVHHHDANGRIDGTSTLQFKAYVQGRARFQAADLHFIWWDEEPPDDVYTEGEARWSGNADGRSVLTFTPLLGMSNVVMKFLGSDVASIRGHVRMGARDCPHMTDEMLHENVLKYPKHEHEARLEGIPLLGSGRVFETAWDAITYPSELRLPDYYPRLWGIDFGINHPFAAVLAAWDRDRDIIYLTGGYRAANELPVVHCAMMHRMGPGIPVAWPHDGHSRDKGSGEALASQYKALGLKMLPSHAAFAGNEGYSTEAAVADMQQRFADGRLRVASNFMDFHEEYGMYHRKDGLIVKQHDDLISATMKIIMAKRHARVATADGQPAFFGNRQKTRPTRRPDVDPWSGRAR